MIDATDLVILRLLKGDARERTAPPTRLRAAPEDRDV
jgi:hypothetical protein